MPFGSDPFRDSKKKWIALCGMMKRHQCLSAVIPFGTILTLYKDCIFSENSHQCLSAVIPFGTNADTDEAVRDKLTVTNAFRQ